MDCHTRRIFLKAFSSGWILSFLERKNYVPFFSISLFSTVKRTAMIPLKGYKPLCSNLYVFLGNKQNKKKTCKFHLLDIIYTFNCRVHLIVSLVFSFRALCIGYGRHIIDDDEPFVCSLHIKERGWRNGKRDRRRRQLDLIESKIWFGTD